MDCYSVTMRIASPYPAWPQGGQAPPSRTPPRAQPRSCFAVRAHHEVDDPPTCSSLPHSYHTARPPCFSPFRSTPTSLLRLQNPPRLLPFQATRARQQLRQDLSHRLCPLAQALAPCSPKPSRSSLIPAETTAVNTSPRPDLLRASLPSLSASLKSR